ncbi:MAG TPA: glutamine--fructose-6-phosphate transaminase (isomerizing) [Candidatus Omnitrophota bacterium]|nr:glutamine--fructose-6-phosphate transaminase (isomerizing) [Candidatus Omnitrophota bacterium]HQO57712.1 glutamine--fructose-6-phosphate transaminase (isomerizing) [Candidatus Omnitrophota bacterium]
MCGIIGYIGNREAQPLLLEGLKKLEYRGYDSAGIGIIPPGKQQIWVQKTRGKIADLVAVLGEKKLPSGHVGLSHTRWATHGVPNHRNAHPHFDCSHKFLIVHNGIIENYENLKARLVSRQHIFRSDTDTEVIAHLIEECFSGDLLDAVRKAVKQLRGAFALGIISSFQPDQIVAVRIGSPLIIGVGRDENFIASDVPAVMDSTHRVIYLEDGHMARLTRERVEVFTFEGQRVSPPVHKVAFNVEAVQKQGYAHFMLKEIHEQPAVIEQMLKARLKGSRVVLDGLTLSQAQIKRVKHIYIVACGTAYHAGLVGRYWLEALTPIPVTVDMASEFRYRDPIVDKNTLIIAISQSGETADTLAAAKEAKARGAQLISICNVVGSSLARESDGILYTHAGPEIGVASTKAYVAQLCMLYLLGLQLSQSFQKISSQRRRHYMRELKKVPDLYREILRRKKAVHKIAKKNSHFGCFLFLGRNINFPSALEGALKLKEISYIPAEGYPAGEMKHGPIALIDEYRAVICVAPQSSVYEKMISNIQEIRARKGKVIAIATEGDLSIKKHAHMVFPVPPLDENLTPLLVALPLQLLAYYIAVHLGCNVDQPRNLAKSVTVE